MKKRLLPILAVAGLFAAVSCSNDDDNNNPANTTAAEVTSTVTSGTWKITSFTEDGDNHTSYFTGYTFTFGGSTVLTAANGTNTYSGNWSVESDDDSDDDNPSGDIDLDIYFAAPDNFTELNEDWDILERTDTKLRLRHESGGNGSIDNLTFEKN